MPGAYARTWSDGRPDMSLSLTMLRQLRAGAFSSQGEGLPKTSRTNLTDVQIGTRDSVKKVALARDPGSGNLFSVLLFTGDGTVSGVSMNFSSDGGQTWFESASIESDYDIPDIGVTCAAGYFDVAGIYDSSRQVLIDRFYTDNGLPYDTSFAHPQVACRTQGDEKFGQIAIASNVYAFNNRVYCAALSNDGHIRFVAIRDTGSSGVFEYASDEFGGAHGLSISFNLTFRKGSFAYIAFIDTSRLLCVDGIPDTMIGLGNVNRHWRDDGHIAADDGSGSSITSLDDTILVAYTSADGGLQRALISTSVDSSATQSWTAEFVDDTTAASSFAAVTMESGNGIGLMYRLAAIPAQLLFSSRAGISSAWSSPVAVSTLRPISAQGSLASTGSRTYAFAYLAPDSAASQAAFFSTGTLTSVDESPKATMPQELTLFQNYPNPFNPTTGIRYSVPSKTGRDGQVTGNSYVRLVVYDLLGREVTVLVNESVTPGTHEVRFDASGLASGVYFYRLAVGNFAETKAMILAK